MSDVRPVEAGAHNAGDFTGSLQHLGRDLSRWRCAMGRLSGVEREELWDRWEAGESQRSIGRHLGRSPSTVRAHLLSGGWRRPGPSREWCDLRLSVADREEISRGLARNESLRSIARRLGRAPSTVSREVKVNGGLVKYRATVAHRASRMRAKRPKSGKLAECPRLREAVEEKLLFWWSPGQISRWLVHAYPDDEEMRVSHETIYQSLFVQGRGLSDRLCKWCGLT